MGNSSDDLLAGLIEIQEAVEQKDGYDPGSLHRKMSLQFTQCDPIFNSFSQRQLERLLGVKRGYGMIFSNEAAGGGTEVDSLRDALDGNKMNSKFVRVVDITNDVDIPENMGRQIEKFLKDEGSLRHAVFVIRLCADKEIIREMIEQSAFVSEKRRRMPISVLLILDSRATLEYCRIDEAERVLIEQAAMTVQYPLPWSLGAIKHRLEIADKIDNYEVVSHVAKDTGGWPFLIDALFKASGSNDDLREFSIHAKKEKLDSYLAGIGHSYIEKFSETLLNIAEYGELSKEDLYSGDMDYGDLFAFPPGELSWRQFICYLQKMGIMKQSPAKGFVVDPLVLKALKA